MKISRRGNRIQKQLTFLKISTAADISVRSANIERVRAHFEKMRPVYKLASEKWARLFDESKIQGGVMAGPIHKHEK